MVQELDGEIVTKLFYKQKQLCEKI